MRTLKKGYCYPLLFQTEKYKYLLVFFLLLSSANLSAQFYQGSQMTFGKSRVQFKEFEWSFYRFQHYDTYFYVGGQELAAFTAQIAEQELIDLEKRLEYKLDGRIQFIIFNRLSDLRQSNMGVGNEDQPGNIGGYTRILGNKVFLYYNQSREDFVKQIRAGIAQVLINQLMYGGDIKDRLQNAAILSLPDWYLQGLVSFLAEKWNTDLDNRMRDAFLTLRYKKFNRLEGEDAIIAGHSIWFYLASTYGENTIPNVLYMTKSGRNIENGFLFVYGISFKSLMKNWYEFYKKKYSDAEYGRTVQSTPPLLKRKRKNTIFSHTRLSPDGKYLAYTTNELGRYKVYLYNLSEKKKKCIMRGGYKTLTYKTDKSFPVLAWHPTGKVLSIIREHKGEILLTFYTLDTKKKDESTIFNFDKILDFSYSDDGHSFVMSAVQKGQTDIFVYNLRARTAEQITRDAYDDITPSFINNSRTILFSSNRTNDTLYADQGNFVPPVTGYDVFAYDYRSKSFALRRITRTPFANEIQAMQYDKENLTYLSDENGIFNRYIAHIDSVISSIDTVVTYRYIVNNYPQTDHSRSILEQNVNSKKKKISEVIFNKGRYNIHVFDLSKAIRSSREKLDPTEYRSTLIKEMQRARQDSLKKNKPSAKDSLDSDTSRIDINNYIFQSEFSGRKNRKKPQKDADSVKADPGFIVEQPNNFSLPTQRVYEPSFSADYFVTQLDNSLISPGYQVFGGGGYFNPSLGALIKVGASDLFEDYKVVGGFRIPFDLNNTEYLLTFDDLKKRLDKQVVFHRQTTLIGIGFVGLARLNTNEARFIAKWPFSETSAVRGTLGYRNDRFVLLSTDTFTLKAQNAYANWGSFKAEYIYDNTISTGLNLYNGTRAKVFGEIYKQVDRSRTTLIVLGADVRHYERVHRDIIWANRLAGSTSTGNQKLIYYLGSVDNPIIFKSNAGDFDMGTPIDYSQNYGFQANATNMRGFSQNVRNGNNFILLNSELRIPLFKYLLNRPIKSEFIKNFQIVGFGDAGTAWVGASPFENNILNTEKIVRQPLTITLHHQRDPFVYGYGFGLRSKLLGYFIKGDWAWGIEDNVVKPRVFYLSLNLDF